MIATIKGTKVEGTPEEVYQLLQMMKEKDKREKQPFNMNIKTSFHNNKLAIAKGTCPFPTECSQRHICIKDNCNYDTCTNGYAYRYS